NFFVYYENGLPGGTKGLPQGGAFTSFADGMTETHGQLQPYNAPNALLMDVNTPTGTITLAPPDRKAYNLLAIFAASANASGTATGNVTLNYTDGTSAGGQVYNAFDWFFVTGNNALNNLGRVSTYNNLFDDGSAGNPRIYQTTIDLAAGNLN